jgi:hypothetical protein
MLETGAIIGNDGVIYWHIPNNRSSVLLPDSQELWEVLWFNRKTIQGFAHSHPGVGTPIPSYEDLTTFSAVELALGRRLKWWITSANQVSLTIWFGPGKLSYSSCNIIEPNWVPKLRQLSRIDEVGNDRFSSL